MKEFNAQQPKHIRNHIGFAKYNNWKILDISDILEDQETLSIIYKYIDESQKKTSSKIYCYKHGNVDDYKEAFLDLIKEFKTKISI